MMLYRPCTSCLRSLGILLGLLLVIGSLVLTPWWQKLDEYHRKIEQHTAQISRFQQMQARRPALERELQQLRGQIDRNNLFISAETAALAAADLQQRVKQAVASAGGQLVSTQNLTEPAGDRLTEIVIRVRMNGDGDVLLKVLHGLESNRPLLLVDNLTVRSNKRFKGRGRERLVEFNIDTYFDLIGFLRGDQR